MLSRYEIRKKVLEVSDFLELSLENDVVDVITRISQRFLFELEVDHGNLVLIYNGGTCKCLTFLQFVNVIIDTLVLDVDEAVLLGKDPEEQIFEELEILTRLVRRGYCGCC